jgi:hypothetical protein
MRVREQVSCLHVDLERIIAVEQSSQPGPHTKHFDYK